jgi:hypothetical protein
MSLKYLQTILLSIIFLFKIIKNEDDFEITNKSLKFLIEENKIVSKKAYSKNIHDTKINSETEEYNLIDRIKEINPLEIFTSSSTAMLNDNKSFNVRCFWVDLDTFIVYDLIRLKTKE